MANATGISSLLGVFIGAGGGIIGCVIWLAVFALWIWALIDVIQNKGMDSTQRIIWVLVIIFLPVLGSILYLLIGRK